MDKLTVEDIIKKQCQYCQYRYLYKCNYEVHPDSNSKDIIDNCGVFDEEVARWKPYFESLHERKIAETRTELLNEIINLSYKTCGYDCQRCLPMSQPACKWLTSQLNKDGKKNGE